MPRVCVDRAYRLARLLSWSRSVTRAARQRGSRSDHSSSGAVGYARLGGAALTATSAAGREIPIARTLRERPEHITWTQDPSALGFGRGATTAAVLRQRLSEDAVRLVVPAARLTDRPIHREI